MTTAALPYLADPFTPGAAVPVRSSRTSLILAEPTRRRQSERQQRRAERAWRAWWDCGPFEVSCTPATPEVVFPGAMPLVYAWPQR
jgi:hypothetical protein